MEISCNKQLHNETLPSTDISALGHIKLQFKPAATFAFQLLPVTCTAALTHPGGLHSFLPGGSSSRLFRGTIPMAACMMVMNFLNFIFQIPLQLQKRHHTGHNAPDAATPLQIIFPKSEEQRDVEQIKNPNVRSSLSVMGILQTCERRKWSPSFRGHKPKRQRSPAQRLLRAPVHQRSV